MKTETPLSKGNSPQRFSENKGQVRIKDLFEKERQEKMRHAVNVGCIIGCILIPLFGFLDYLVAPVELQTLLIIRFACSLSLFILLLLNKSSLGEKYSVYFAIYGVASVGISIAWMTRYLGGPESSYYAGINLAVIVGGLLMPMTIFEGLVTFVTIYFSYIIACFPFLTGKNLIAFYSNTFFIISTMFIVLVGFRFKEHLSLQELENRVQLIGTRKELEKHTENLERAVRQRTASLVHSERMAAVGQLAAGVSHEFNNILTAIIAHGEFAKLQGNYEDLDKAVDVAIYSSKRASEIARNLLTFSRQTPQDRNYINIRGATENALSLMESSFKKASIEIRKDLPDDLPSIWASETEIQQIIVNLIINAFHAMDEKGILSIVAKERGKEIILEVSDTGCGIPPENMEKLFEPFFTTKGVWGDDHAPGTGLGLSVVHGIVSSLGGRIEIESKVDKGTKFIVYFPIPPKGLEKEREVSRETVPFEIGQAGKRLNVLVVDDEKDILMGVSKLLEARGHATTPVHSGDMALKLLESERFDLVITDLLMPGAGGEEVLSRCQRFSPPIPCMVITGIGKPGLVEEILGLGAFTCLRKPFTMIEFVNVITRFEKELENHQN